VTGLNEPCTYSQPLLVLQSAQKKALKTDKKAKAQADLLAAQKGKGKGKKKSGKAIAEEEEDLDALLEKFKADWELDHAVFEEKQSGPPSRRANATLTPCPLGNDLWLFGGEYFDGEKCVTMTHYLLGASFTEASPPSPLQGKFLC
jgi:hypothetical protein